MSMNLHPRSAVFGAVLSLLSAPLSAVTFVPPRDYAELARSAELVVLAVTHGSTCRERGAMVFTDTELAVIRTLRGGAAPGAIVRVETPGGEVDGAQWLVAGSPRFEPGVTYLLCLSRKDDEASAEDALWLPAMLSYGVLEETAGANGSRLLVPLAGSLAGAMPRPDGAPVELVEPYEKDALLAHLGEVLAGRGAWSSDAVRADAADIVGLDVGDAEGGGAGVPAGCSFFESGGRQLRWRAFDTGGVARIYANPGGDPSMRDGAFWIVQEAMDLWMGITGTSFNLVFGGEQALTVSCTTGQDAAADYILFNDPCSDIADLDGCGGVLAYGGPLSNNSSHSFAGDGGASWWTITGWIVVVNNGTGCLGDANYRVMVAHELGHGLGFGHVEDSGALMFASCCHNINATDRLCARFAYPAADPLNQRPRASAGVDLSVVLVGDTIRLAGSASDDGVPGGPLEVEWKKLAGPGSVSFADDAALETTARFSASGSYLLGLQVSDGELVHIDQVEVDVEVFAGGSVSVSFQQGTAGYSGTADTFIAQSAPGTSFGTAGEIGVDSDDPSGSGLENHMLLRFDGIFGAEAGRVPPGAAISRARIELQTTNSGAGASVHRMLRPWTESDTWSTFGGDGIQAGIEAVAVADTIAAGQGEPVRVDVTQSLAAWSRDPASNLGWVFLPAGSDGWDVSASEGAAPPRLIVEYPLLERAVVVALGDVWHYFKGTRDPPADWRSPSFVPAAGWLSGATGIGFGDGDDATVLTDMEDGYLTVYCRRAFELGNPGLIGRLELAIDYDDGFVAYLNGVEVARSSNLGAPGAPVSRNTPASPGHEAGSVETFSLPAAALVAGVNVLAVEVHNADISSSDLSFRPELRVDFLLVPGDAEWRYLRGVSPVPSDWNQVSFDDGSWESGTAGFGYGDGDDVTVLDDMRGSYGSVFLRRSFALDCPGAIASMRLTVIYDDGFAAYLNGEEVARANLPAGTPTYQTLASSSLEPTAASFDVPADLLRRGTNVLALSAHNSDVDSSDFSLMAVLVPILVPEDEVDCEGTGPVSRFRRGDAGNDGSVDVSDAVRLLLALFAGAEPIACADAADVDDDGALAVNDAAALLGYLFRGGSPPAFPGARCGEDLSADDLGECSTAGCGR
jgi:hypothetical protein